MLTNSSATGESECPFDCNFTFAFFEDHITKLLQEKVPNAYFPEIQVVSSLKDVTNDLKKIRAGRVSVYRCIRMKDGSTQECQISLQYQLVSSFDCERDVSPFRRNRLNAASPQFVAQYRPQLEAAVANSPSSPSYLPFPIADFLPQTSTTPARYSRGEDMLELLHFFPPFEMSPPSHKTPNLLACIRAYEKACLLKYGNDCLDAEGAPVYTVMQKERRRMSLHAVCNRTLNDGDAATAVFHMINLAAMKNGL